MPTSDDRISFRRRFPTRLMWETVGYLTVAAGAAAMVILLFGREPARLSDGTTNPLRYLPYATIALLALGLVPFLVALIRRPLVRANRRGIALRPGCLAIRRMPWTWVVEIAGYAVATPAGSEAYLLVQCADHVGASPKRPRWWDQGILREAVRATGGTANRYHLAVRMRDFQESPVEQLSLLAELAPSHVKVIDRLDTSWSARRSGRNSARR